MNDAPMPRARWYRWDDRNGKCRVSFPVRRARVPPARRRSRPFDLYSAVYDGVLWTLGVAVMMVPLAFLFILPHVITARWH
jgi:hypothetical protein